MDITREISGANFLESVTGYSGEDVRGEIFDGGCQTGHQEFVDRPIVTHGPFSIDSHGTACMGNNFSHGVNAMARGLLPDGQGIFADYSNWGLNGTNRRTCSMELLNPPYQAVFQTASVGSPQTTQYTTISAEADGWCFDSDLIHCQSQSNLGTQSSRPQAWAKNMVSGGGIRHYNTLTRADDMWSGGASIGPASDGRIKPTFTHFYDMVTTTYSTSTTGYGSFSGTSNATPTIAGCFGLFFQMWDAGIFGNTVIPGASVFQNRAHPSTAKAMMIVSAYQYPFSGTTHDKTRTHQGWGMPDLQKLYNLRNNFYIVDESDVLLPLETSQHTVNVVAGTPELLIAMVYSDLPGNPAVQTQHRINDLTLKVTSPTGTVYWGNNGLYAGNYSVAGGSADIKNTEECVFLQNPAAGPWVIEIQANEIIQDSHVETTVLDADYALVVAGVGAPYIPNLQVTLTPINPPIVIPAAGGSFNFDAQLQNLEATGQSFNAWIMMRNPSGVWQGPMLGPLALTLTSGANIVRSRIQNIAGTNPAGQYVYCGYVGQYPSAKWDSSFFNFTKSATDNGEPWVDNNDNTGESFEVDPTAVPQDFALLSNYPNPFNPTTTLGFVLPEVAKVRLAVYDVRGRLVATLVDGFRQAGTHEVTFDATGLTSGVYVYRLEAGHNVATGKMVLMK
ncbi:MAG: T9SS C-terminal target domain-containing protein [Candidatus Zixiibacteriota bacterium]|nr:MAG: T9SS C-terminal target domain-containing protein [candidate division Zixibacteria bacterium]